MSRFRDMANEANIVGAIEIYDRNQFKKVTESINALQNNFLNITIHESFLNNRGSILIPFAKSCRADEDDDEFICEKLIEVINEFSFIDMFAIELFIDSMYLKNRCYRVLAGNGKYEKIEKFSFELSPLNRV